jgi:hypothetical protein
VRLVVATPDARYTRPMGIADEVTIGVGSGAPFGAPCLYGKNRDTSEGLG